MKNLFILLVVVITLSACEKIISAEKTVTGEGPVKSEQRMVSSFSRIESRIGANINIIKSSSEQLRVSAQGNLLPLIHTVIINNGLIISCSEKSMKTDSAITIDVYTASLEEVSIPGAGQVLSQCPLKRIFLTGSGNVFCSGISKDVNIILSGSGNIDLSNMKVESADIYISGSGNVKTTVSDRMDVTISGVGNVYYKGNPFIRQQISGIGNVLSLE